MDTREKALTEAVFRLHQVVERIEAVATGVLDGGGTVTIEVRATIRDEGDFVATVPDVCTAYIDENGTWYADEHAAGLAAVANDPAA